MNAPIYLVELSAHNGTSVQTIRLSTEAITTSPTSTPANTLYEPRLKDPGSFSTFLFSQGTTHGRAEIGYGEIRVVNSDGELDDWLSLGFDGQPLVIKRLERDAPFSSAVTLFRGTVDRIESSQAWSEWKIRIYDRLIDLDKPLQANRYAGTTLSGGPTAEGNEQLKDTVKPLTFGRCFNVPAVPANPFDLIYQVHDGAVLAITVYDAGVPLTPDGDVATVAALQSATIKPGRYRTCLSLGLFRLGGTPYKDVTADVTEGASRSVSDVVGRILAKAGVTDLEASTFTALASAAPQEVGVHVAEEETTLNISQFVLDSIGGWLTVNALGNFEVGRLSAPSGPVAEFDEITILGDGRVDFLTTEDEGRGLPAWRILLNYQRLWRTHSDRDLAACVDVDTRSYLAREYREVKSENASTKNKHKLAPELSFNTLITSSADATAEASRRLTLYGIRRDRLKLRFPVNEARTIKLGDTVTIILPRFGYTLGRLMRVIGRKDDYAAETIELDLWG